MRLELLTAVVALVLALAVMFGFTIQLPGPGFAAKVAVERVFGTHSDADRAIQSSSAPELSIRACS